MKINFTKKTLLCLSISSVLYSGLAQATALEVIEVTAQKRSQSIQAVGVSVTALSGDQMDALGLDSTQEITQQIPGLQIQSFSPAFTVFNLRGISQNNFTDNLEAPVAAYFDDVYVGSMNAIGGQMYDLERTEVLRGPQGTLFGRNATGGLIHFVTKKASDEDFNGYMSTEISEFGSYSVDGAVGGALSDSVRGRIAGRWETSDGYLQAGSIPAGTLGPNSPEINAVSDSMGADGYSLRGNLQIDATNDTTISLTASYSKDNDVPVGAYVVYLTGLDENGLGGEIDASNPLTGDVFKHAGSDKSVAGIDTGLDREMTSVTATIDTIFSNDLELSSITNWLDMDKSNREDSGGGVVPFAFYTDAQYQQVSQELRLSDTNDDFRWQLGMYFLKIDLEAQSATDSNAVTNGNGGPAGAYFEGASKLNSTNWSIFGQAEYDLNDSLTVIAGYRWSEDDKDFEFVNRARAGALNLPDGTVLFDLDNEAVGEYAGVPEIDYGDYAARLQLNWQLDDTLVFLSYNRGIKGGNWSPNSNVKIENFKHKAETLHSYELGIKTSFWDDDARLNATAFYYDYEDYQTFSLVSFVPQISNSDATSIGGEIELTLTPTDNWDILLGLSVIDSEVDEVLGAIPGSIVEGAEFPNAPRYSANYLFRYYWEALEGEFSVQLDGVYNDKQYIEGHNSASSLQEAYGRANASINYNAKEGDWGVRLWIKNITNAENAVYSLDVGGFVVRQYESPRWVGITASYNW